MSGSKDIVIEQLRADVERLRDDRADLQERCNRLTGERNAALLLMKDEEARAEKAERERDEWCRQCNLASEAQADALNDASVARRERDEARAERDARPDISAEDAAAWVRCIDVSDEPGGAADVVKYRAVNDALRAHAAKAGKP